MVNGPEVRRGFHQALEGSPLQAPVLAPGHVAGYPPAMTLRSLLALALLAAPLHGEAPATIELHYPRLTFGELLGLQSELNQRNVIVSDRGVLKKELALDIPGELDRETAIKVIEAVLVLEGYELVDKNGEFHLTQLLKEDERRALWQSLDEGPRPPGDEDPPKTPVPGRVIVRPASSAQVVRPEEPNEPEGSGEPQDPESTDLAEPTDKQPE